MTKKLLAIFKKMRPYLVVFIVLSTVGLFVYYFHSHPEYLRQLLTISPSVIIALLVVNFGLITAVAVINHVSAQICNVNLDKRESFLLTIYSSLANFFGPLQSGPGVRAGYLKARHQVRLRDYTFVTLIGYGFFAVISALFLVVGVMPWWVSVLLISFVTGVSFVTIQLFQHKKSGEKTRSKLLFSPRNLGLLGLATFFQVSCTAVRYGIQLAAVGAHASLGQIISYAGAANFSLFVSITPDGIGIREAFLLFTQRLHGVSTHDIVAASLIDRVSYVVFLAVLGVIALALHAHKRFGPPSSTKESKLADTIPKVKEGE